jgi:hypothetical protein
LFHYTRKPNGQPWNLLGVGSAAGVNPLRLSFNLHGVLGYEKGTPTLSPGLDPVKRVKKCSSDECKGGPTAIEPMHTYNFPLIDTFELKWRDWTSA